MWVYPPRSTQRDTWTNQLVESTGEADKADPCTYQLVQSTGEANRLIYGPTSWYIYIHVYTRRCTCPFVKHHKNSTKHNIFIYLYIYIYIYILCLVLFS